MKVLIVSVSPSAPGLAAVDAAIQATRLRRQGDEVEMISPTPSSANGLADLCTLGGLLRLLMHTRRADRTVIHFRPELFFPSLRALSFLRRWPAVAALFALGRRLEVKVYDAPCAALERAHGLRGVVARRLWRRLLTLPAATFVPDEVEQERLSAAIRVAPERIPIQQEPIDAGDRDLLRRKLHLEPNALCFLSIGLPHPPMDFDRLIRDLERVPGDQVRLDILASPKVWTPESPTQVDELRALVAATPRVALHEDALTAELLDHWIVASDVVILTQRDTSLPGLLERALRWDRPAILTGGTDAASQTDSRVRIVSVDDDLVVAMSEMRAVGAPVQELDRIVLDFPLRSRPRFGWGAPEHPIIAEILASNRERYRSLVNGFAAQIPRLKRIPAEGASSPGDPCWINDFLPGLDAVALYGIVASLRPRLYLEVGSGNSTKFARRAIQDHALATKIVSIDPAPRAEVDALCDLVIRKPLEDVDVRIMDDLGPGDILFLDGSHRTLMSSDVTVTFLELLPRLPAGVHVHVHDVWLPCDYPPSWADRFYSEQYLIAAQLLARACPFEVEFPAWYVCRDPDLVRPIRPLWEEPHLRRVQRHGCSFWLATT